MAADRRTCGRASETVRAKVLVNAAGPWVGDVLGGVVKANAPASVRLVQGSHIVVPRMFDHDRCYIFQNSDNRIIFAIPYERDFTLIGTTDQDYVGDPAGVVASEARFRICAPRPAILPQARAARGRGLDLFRRPLAL